jgi:hypothetical protein
MCYNGINYFEEYMPSTLNDTMSSQTSNLRFSEFLYGLDTKNLVSLAETVLKREVIEAYILEQRHLYQQVWKALHQNMGYGELLTLSYTSYNLSQSLACISDERLYPIMREVLSRSMIIELLVHHTDIVIREELLFLGQNVT